MAGYIIRRLLTLFPLLFVISVLTFTMVRMIPGDIVMLYLGERGETSAFQAETVKILRHELGLDRPIHIQYLHWMQRTLQGDLGRSFVSRQEVRSMLLDALPKTAYLALLSLFFAILIGVPTGLISAVRRNSPLDVGATLFATLGIAVPNFFLAILLILVLGVFLGWFPTFGYRDPLTDPLGNLRFMVLPMLTLGLHMCASIMRQVRSSMLNVLAQDYVRTARAKGLHERRVLIAHALRNALIPVVTVIGLQLANLMSGVVIIETVFGIPGIGRVAIEGVHQKDYAVLMGAMVFIVFFVVMVNLLVDISYSFLDPRIRYSKG